MEFSVKDGTNIEALFNQIALLYFKQEQQKNEASQNKAIATDMKTSLLVDTKQRITELQSSKDEISNFVVSYRKDYPVLDKGKKSHKTRDLLNNYVPASKKIF
jgi:hypothetical protein